MTTDPADTSERVPGGAPLDETLNLLGGCPAQHPDGHLCTLARGHAGDHEAHGVAVDRPPYRVWPNSITDGATLIAAERRRQIEAEGWSPEHDDEHGQGEMAGAAVCYIIHALQQDDPYIDDDETWPLPQWPWDRSWWKPSGDPIRNLVKAGALIAAEIDRLQRAADSSTDPSGVAS